MQKKYTVISVLCIYFFLFYSTGEWKKKLSKNSDFETTIRVFVENAEYFAHFFDVFYNFSAKLSLRNQTKTIQN